MRLKREMIADQTGATLIIVVLVLLAVTALGLTAITISTNDLNMAGNDKWQRTGFYNADSGLHGTPLVIAPVFDNNPLVPEGDPGNPANTACLQYLDSSNGTKFETFSKKMLNIVGAGGCDQNLKTTKDIAFRACGIQADMDICPLGARESSGSGVRFGASTEGLGSGAGGKGMYFRITATGDGSSVNSTYNVFGVYRWVEESGGLK